MFYPSSSPIKAIFLQHAENRHFSESKCLVKILKLRQKPMTIKEMK